MRAGRGEGQQLLQGGAFQARVDCSRSSPGQHGRKKFKKSEATTALPIAFEQVGDAAASHKRIRRGFKIQAAQTPWIQGQKPVLEPMYRSSGYPATRAGRGTLVKFRMGTSEPRKLSANQDARISAPRRPGNMFRIAAIRPAVGARSGDRRPHRAVTAPRLAFWM